MSQTPTDTAQQPANDGYAGSDSFRIGLCKACERKVLTARDLDDGELIDICVHCDQPVDQKTIQWVGPRGVVQLGYVIDGYDDEECESHGGCRDGSCGVRQPGQ